MTTTWQSELEAHGGCAPFDLRFAERLGELAGETRVEVLVAVSLVSRALRDGHVCLDLRRRPSLGALEDAALGALAWAEALRTSPLVGDDAAATPLVLHGERFYLRRYWRYESRLAQALRERAAVEADDRAPRALREVLDRHWGVPGETVDPQRLAAAVALRRRLVVISGGPGTGKTFTVARVLALLVQDALDRGEPAPRILLSAPTGKAATRLLETVRGTAAQLSLPAAVADALPKEAATLHRALGAMVRDGGTEFRHGRHDPLTAQIVVVDEASMVDVAVMAQLFDAVADDARLILLGDRQQLASVDPGAVLADICPPAEVAVRRPAFAAELAEMLGHPVSAGEGGGSPLGDCIVPLTRNFRYRGDAGIGRLADAINVGDPEAAFAALRETPDGQLDWREGGAGDGRWLPHAVAGYHASLQAGPPAARLAALGRFRVLTAHRVGRAGATAVSQTIEAALGRAGLIDAGVAVYDGRPIMVRVNDPGTGLFNGDIGLIAPHDGRLRAWFAQGEQPRAISPARLPEHETAFALTVHKAQGSEFDEVLVLLPDEPSPVVTRELLYTAVTRARRRVTLVGPRHVLAEGIARRVERHSGLGERLWGV